MNLLVAYLIAGLVVYPIILTATIRFGTEKHLSSIRGILAFVPLGVSCILLGLVTFPLSLVVATFVCLHEEEGVPW